MCKTYQVESFELGKMANYIHLIHDIKSKKVALFDPAWDAKYLLDFIDSKQLILDKIFITHGHFDHINAIPDLLQNRSVEVYVNKKEYHNSQIPELVKSVNFIDDNDLITLGDTKINCISTPGHSIGGTCYMLSDDIITGDTIFIYGCGHCSLPGANTKQLFLSLQHLKTLLDPMITVHTGHNYSIHKTTTWQAQLDGNPFLQINNLKDFTYYRDIIHDTVRTYPMQAVSVNELQKCLKQF